MIKSFLMKSLSILFLIALAFFSFRCSDEPKPVSFGWYIVNSDNELIKLQSQQNLKSVSTRREIITGFSSLSQTKVTDTLIHFIIYDNEVSSLSQQLKLAKLEFENSTVSGMRLMDVKLFIPKKLIPIDIVPIKDETNMYKVVPEANLQNGNYVLFLSNTNKFDKNSTVYDFKLASNGEEINFPSNEWLIEDVKKHYMQYEDNSNIVNVSIVNISNYEKHLDIIANVTFDYYGKELIRQHELEYKFNEEKKDWENSSYSMPPLLNDVTTRFKKR